MTSDPETTKALRRWRDSELHYAEMARPYLQGTAATRASTDVILEMVQARQRADACRNDYFSLQRRYSARASESASRV